MRKLSKVDQLKAILQRLKKFKQQGGDEGIDQKIDEVQSELKRHLKKETVKGNQEEENWGKEVVELSKVEQLRASLKRLNEIKNEGGVAGIDQRIAEVYLELR